MLLPPFEASRWKVLRARTHMHDLEDATQAYAQRRKNIDCPEAPWINIPLILGDAIHNLRSALDLLACDAVRLNNRSIKGVYFPFATDRDTLEVQIGSKNFNRASAEAVQLLREQEPWRGGRLDLRAIHDLDIMDKHELILPVLHHASKAIVKGPRLEIGPIVRLGHKVDLQLRTSGPPIGSQTVIGSLAFREDMPFAGESVYPTLMRLVETVDGVIQAFKTALLPRGTNA